MKKTVMPKQAAPVERLSPATAGAAGAEKGGIGPALCYRGQCQYFHNEDAAPFAGDDAE
jgi:prenylated cyclic peptide (anacyclamide/piricyclamide family)